MAKAAFFDRDGIINIDKGYVFRREDFCFQEGIFDLCHLIQDKGFLIFIITNQAGIGRGLFTLDAFNAINNWMLNQFTNNHIAISKVYFCPHHPTEGKGEFRKDCRCRKPNPGMILKAKREFDLSLKDCLLIGDKESDIQAGIHAGLLHNYLIRPEAGSLTNLNPCIIFNNLKELIRHLFVFLQ